MIVSRRMKLVFAVVWLSVPALCAAGRPVFGSISLPQLVHRAKLIVLATKAHAETAETLNGCTSLEWHVTVVKVIKTSPGMVIKPGNTIRVRHNVIAYEDCSLRRVVGPSGASFAADRYQPSIPDLPETGRVIVFLEPSDQGFQLVAAASFESADMRAEVEGLLTKP